MISLQAQWTSKTLWMLITWISAKLLSLFPIASSWQIWLLVAWTKFTVHWVRTVWMVNKNGDKSGWQLVLSGSLQNSILGPILFNIIMNDLDDEVECKFTDETKLGRNIKLLNSRKALQRDLDKLDQWTVSNCMAFNKVKCQVPHLGHNSPMQQYRLLHEWLEGCLGEGKPRLLGVYPSGQKSQRHPGLHHSVACKTSETIAPMYEALVRLYLEYWAQFCALYYKKGVESPKCSQIRA